MNRRFALCLAFCTLAAPAPAQPVRHAPEPEAPLDARWAWALGEAGSRSVWVGYGIHRLMEPDSWIGSWSTHGNAGPSLSMLLYGQEREPAPDAWRRGDDRRRERVVRELALLFEVGEGRLRAVDVSSLGLHLDLEGRPLYWLGTAEDAASLALLAGHYRRAAADADLREDAVMAISLHDDAGRALPLLRGALEDDPDEDVRAQAAFWVGQRGGAEALGLLRRSIEDDPSPEVREKAVFALSQLDAAAAGEALIDYARTADDRKVRKQAIFWLSQKASRQAVEALADLVFDEAETDVQKQAVFALSQLDADDAIPRLVEIGRTHPNPEVRKQAIFWLGQSDDARALEALIAFLEGR